MKFVRFFPALVLTLLVGLWAAGAFENYQVHFCIEKRFTAEQRLNLVGKKVVIALPNRESKEGTIVGFSPYGTVDICCTTIEQERRENIKVGYQKSTFDSYITVMHE